MTGLEPKLVTALGFLIGIGAGAAIAGRMKGQSLRSGRRCPRCGASLSYLTAAPVLSWFGVRPRCRTCGLASPWLQAALETAVTLIGLIAILTLPMPWALAAGAAGFLAFVLAVRRWG